MPTTLVFIIASLLSFTALANNGTLTLNQDLLLERESPQRNFHFTTGISEYGCSAHAYVSKMKGDTRTSLLLEAGETFEVSTLRDKSRYYDMDGTGEHYIVSAVTARLPYEHSYLVIKCQQEGFFSWFSDPPKLQFMMEEIFSDLATLNKE